MSILMVQTLPGRQFKALFIPLLFLVVSCGGGGGGATLRVFAASSLTGAFNDMARAFEIENPEAEVELDFGGSQRLRFQLEFGAKADVFASADSIQMDLLVAADLVSGTPANFASNALVVIAMAEGSVREISDLAQPGVRVVLGQETVPVGAYSRQLLENLSGDASLGLGDGFKDDVLENLVSGEPNVGFAFQKVALGEVDAGLVYETDMAAALEMGIRDVFFITIPVAANVSARYTIAVIKDASEPELAQAFVRFVLSEAGQRILDAHGFGSP